MSALFRFQCPPLTFLPLAGSNSEIPEVNTKPPTFAACENGPKAE